MKQKCNGCKKPCAKKRSEARRSMIQSVVGALVIGIILLFIRAII